MQRNRKTAKTVSVKDRSAKGKNLRTEKRKKKVDPRMNVKKKQIKANV